MAKSLRVSSHKVSATGRKEYLAKVAGAALSQTTKAYGISSSSKTTCSSIKVSPSMSASAASKILRDGRFGTEKKSIAGRALARAKSKNAKGTLRKAK
jgi:hypothetical protein